MLLLGTLWDPATHPVASSSLYVPLFHRCKEEARRACRAGKKQLVSFLPPLQLWACALAWQWEVPQQPREKLGAWGKSAGGPGTTAYFINERERGLGWSEPLGKAIFLWPFGLPGLTLTNLHAPLGTEVSQGQTTDREAHWGPACQAGHCSRHPGPDLRFPDRSDGNHCPPAPMLAWAFLPVALLFGGGLGSFRMWLGLPLPLQKPKLSFGDETILYVSCPLFFICTDNCFLFRFSMPIRLG